MKRGLFLSFFIRIAIALGFVVAMRIWFNPSGWVLDVVLLIGWAVWAVWAARQVPPQLRGPLLRTVRGSAYVLLVLLGVAAFTLAAFALLLVPALAPFWGEVVFAAVALQLTALRTAAVLVRRAKQRVE